MYITESVVYKYNNFKIQIKPTVFNHLIPNFPHLKTSASKQSKTAQFFKKIY